MAVEVVLLYLFKMSSHIKNGGVVNVYDTFNFEALFVEVTCIDDNRQIILVIYRPRDNDISSRV